MRTLCLLCLYSTILISYNCDSVSSIDTPQLIPTTKARGPGGPAYLYGQFKNYITFSELTNVNLYILDQNDYSDTILSVFINSTNASFKITEMPEGTFDLIISNENIISSKIGKLQFNGTKNSFFNPNSAGIFIDSTFFLTKISDSIGSKNSSNFGYAPSITVYFKSEVSDSIAKNLIEASGYEILRRDEYNDPLFDPFENDVYNLKCPIYKIKTAVEFFTWQEIVLLASPDFLVIEE